MSDPYRDSTLGRVSARAIGSIAKKFTGQIDDYGKLPTSIDAISERAKTVFYLAAARLCDAATDRLYQVMDKEKV